MYFVCLLESLDDKIEIQFKNEIPLTDLNQLGFTKMATKICNLLTNQEIIKSGKVSMPEMPFGDIFKNNTYTFEDYESHGVNHRFFSSEYMSKI